MLYYCLVHFLSIIFSENIGCLVHDQNRNGLESEMGWLYPPKHLVGDWNQNWNRDLNP